MGLGRGWGRRKRNTDMRKNHRLLGTLTGDQNHNLSMCGTILQSTEPAGQGLRMLIYILGGNVLPDFTLMFIFPAI